MPGPGLDPMMAQHEIEDGARLFYRNAAANTWGILNSREEFLKEQPDITRRVLAVYEEARKYALGHYDELKRDFIAVTKLPENVVDKQLKERTELTYSKIGPAQRDFDPGGRPRLAEGRRDRGRAWTSRRRSTTSSTIATSRPRIDACRGRSADLFSGALQTRDLPSSAAATNRRHCIPRAAYVSCRHDGDHGTRRGGRRSAQAIGAARHRALGAARARPRCCRSGWRCSGRSPSIWACPTDAWCRRPR